MEHDTTSRRETVIYGGRKYHRYPLSKRRQLRVYFWRHDKWKTPPFALHRQIWIDHHGEIPEGHIIHHKDGNPLNNEIGNLEAMPRGEHAKMHAAQPEIKRLMREAGHRQTGRIVAALTEWRKTPEAKLVYSENGKSQSTRLVKQLAKWREENPEKAKAMCAAGAKKAFNISARELVCICCGTTFVSTHRAARYCENGCYKWVKIQRNSAKKKGLQPPCGGFTRILCERNPCP